MRALVTNVEIAQMRPANTSRTNSEPAKSNNSVPLRQAHPDSLELPRDSIIRGYEHLSDWIVQLQRINEALNANARIAITTESDPHVQALFYQLHVLVQHLTSY